MKRIFLLLIIIHIFFSQAKSLDVTHRLAGLFLRLETTEGYENRIRINDSIKMIIEGYAASDTVFDHRFSDLKYMGQITSSDKKVKIINWNLILPENENRYFCYVIKKNENGNAVYRLEGTNTDEPVSNKIAFSEKNWYGALYYDIRPVKDKKEVYYVLLGIDFGKDFINRKIIDAVDFTPEGDILFGREVFDTGDNILHRVIFEYDATGVMSLKFHSPRSIVFDHLVPLSQGEKQLFGAEYTLDSYTFNNGIWKFEENVDYRNRD